MIKKGALVDKTKNWPAVPRMLRSALAVRCWSGVHPISGPSYLASRT